MTNQFLSLMLDPFVDGRAGAADAPPVLGMAAPPTARAQLCAGRRPCRPTRRRSGAAAALDGLGVGLWRAGHVSGDPGASAATASDSSAGGVVAGLDYHPPPTTVLGFAMGGARGQLVARQRAWRRQHDRAAGRPLRRDPLGPGLCRRRALVHQPLGFDQPQRARRKPQGRLRRPELRRAGREPATGWRRRSAPSRPTPPGRRRASIRRAMPKAALFGNSFALGFRRMTRTRTSAANSACASTLAADRRHDDRLPGRLAWAHDWFSDYDLSATFVAAPISYVATGAAPSHDLALIWLAPNCVSAMGFRYWASSTPNSPATRPSTPGRRR